MKVIPSLTGDLELDATVPYWPRTLPEITWIPLSATKILAAGSLNANLLPSRRGKTSFFSVLHKLDGETPLDDLINGKSQAQQDTRHLIRLLFQAGLIEDGSDALIPEGSAFHALTIDQTRLHRNRKNALASSQRLLRMLGIPPSMLKVFKSVGINSEEATSKTRPAFQLLMLDPDGYPASKDKPDDNILTLPIRLHGNCLDIGPWLPAQGGCTLADLQTHISQEASNRTIDGNTELLEAFCAHTITLLLAGTSPLVMASTLYRISIDDTGPACGRVAISRLANKFPNADPALRKSLLGRAESVMPAMRHVGTKTHEVHHLPRNLMAALEIQESGYAPLEIVAGLSEKASSRILRVLSCVFGYKRIGNGQLYRNCPSGGNLGSPEPLVWGIVDGMLHVYRYIPVLNKIECVLKTPIPNTAENETGILCLGNKEKMCRKYGRFGESLINLDGGVAKAFFHLAAKAECIHLKPLFLDSKVPVPLNRLIAERNHYYTPLWAFTLQPAIEWRTVLPDKIIERARLVDLIKKRRSVRVFDAASISPEYYVEYIHSARTGIWPEPEKKLSCFITPILRVREAGNQDFYRIDDKGALFQLRSADEAPELFLQKNLDNAPFSLFLTADLLSFLEHREKQDLDALVSMCGQWMGILWLSLSSSGLGGCPCGAAVEMDLQAVLPIEYRSHNILASFVAGKPAS